MHLSNKMSFPLKIEWAATRVANMGENTKYCAKEERHRYCTTLLLACGHGDGFTFFLWITELIEFLHCLERAKHSNTTFSASTFAYKANKKGPGTFYGLTTRCSTCQSLS